jgi:hypothetical protein
MTVSIGAVLVLPPGHSPQDVLDVAPPRFRAPGEGLGSSWDVAGLADGRIGLESNAVGFDLLYLRFSTNEYARTPEKVIDWTDDFAVLGQRLRAVFGFMTRYEHELDASWLEQNVLVPLLLEEPERIRLDEFERVLIKPQVSQENGAGSRSE